jgi:hypothetical protein
MIRLTFRRRQPTVLALGQWLLLTCGASAAIVCAVGALTATMVFWQYESQEDFAASHAKIRLIWMVIFGVAALGVLFALTTWRYWALITTEQVHEPPDPPSAAKKSLGLDATRWLGRLNKVAIDYEPLWKMSAALFIPVFIAILSIAVTALLND